MAIRGVLGCRLAEVGKQGHSSEKKSGNDQCSKDKTVFWRSSNICYMGHCANFEKKCHHNVNMNFRRLIKAKLFKQDKLKNYPAEYSYLQPKNRRLPKKGYYLKQFGFNKTRGSKNLSLIVILKFIFSKKATKIDKIFTIDLTLTTWRQIDG